MEAGSAELVVVEDGTMAELGRRSKLGRYDVVHLSGHGALTRHGSRLILQGDEGQRVDVSPEELVAALERGQAMPSLVMVSSCHSASPDSGVPSLAAELVAKGVPAVVGWVRPVGDLEATRAARDLYDRLCTGHGPEDAAAFARRRLFEGDKGAGIRPSSACQAGRPRVLVTSTASFEAGPGPLPLDVVPLGALEPASVRKLWFRGRGEGLGLMPPGLWEHLAERLGRNARVLDWARSLINGQTPEYGAELLRRAEAELPHWRPGECPSEEQDRLAAHYLRTLAFERAREKVSRDAQEFVRRARVHGVPVPPVALAELATGLNLELEQHLPALANLGPLELGRLHGELAYGVSTLVEREFRAQEPERWHDVAARFWAAASQSGDGTRADEVRRAWQHALAAGNQPLADRLGPLLDGWLMDQGLYRESVELAGQHVQRFPQSASGLCWAGATEALAGSPRAALPLLTRSVEMALAQGLNPLEQAACHTCLGRGLTKLSHHSDARVALTTAPSLTESVGGERRLVATILHELARALQAQGDLTGARKNLERALAIYAEVLGAERHPSVAASLHALAGVLQAEQKREEAAALYERVRTIQEGLYGTLDQHHSAETEVPYGALLLQLGRAEEGMKSLAHAQAVLEAQVPNHPLVVQLRRFFGESEGSASSSGRSDPSELAHRAIRARSERAGLDPALRSELDAMGDGRSSRQGASPERSGRR